MLIETAQLLAKSIFFAVLTMRLSTVFCAVICNLLVSSYLCSTQNPPSAMIDKKDDLFENELPEVLISCPRDTN